MAPPTPPPTGAGAPPAKPGGKRLPLWAWAVAGAAGLLVGILLLRRQPQKGQPGEDEPVADAPPQKPYGQGAVVEPLLEALGLQPPSTPFHGGSSDGGGGGGDGGGGDGGGGSATGTETSLASAAYSVTGSPSQSPSYLGYTPPSSPSYVGTGGITLSGGGAPAPSAPAPSGGGGSSSFKAQ